SAMGTAGLTARAHPEGGLIVDAEPEEVGRAALAGGVALARLGPSESAGLEQLFFDLTSGAPDEPAPAPADLQEAARCEPPLPTSMIPSHHAPPTRRAITARASPPSPASSCARCMTRAPASGCCWSVCCWQSWSPASPPFSAKTTSTR